MCPLALACWVGRPCSQASLILLQVYKHREWWGEMTRLGDVSWTHALPRAHTLVHPHVLLISSFQSALNLNFPIIYSMLQEMRMAWMVTALYSLFGDSIKVSTVLLTYYKVDWGIYACSFAFLFLPPHQTWAVKIGIFQTLRFPSPSPYHNKPLML